MGRLVRGPGLPLMVPRMWAPTHLLWALSSTPEEHDLVPDLCGMPALQSPPHSCQPSHPEQSEGTTATSTGCSRCARLC